MDNDKTKETEEARRKRVLDDLSRLVGFDVTDDDARPRDGSAPLPLEKWDGAS